MVPLLLPIAAGYGVHPVHLGIVFLANMQVGYFTPPVGMNLFIAAYRFNRPILDLYCATVPFMLILLTAALIITYWPVLSLALLSRRRRGRCQTARVALRDGPPPARIFSAALVQHQTGQGASAVPAQTCAPIGSWLSMAPSRSAPARRRRQRMM